MDEKSSTLHTENSFPITLSNIRFRDFCLKYSVFQQVLLKIAIIGGDLALSIAGYACADKLLSYVQKDANGEYMKDSDGHYIIADEKAAGKWVGAIVGVGLGSMVYYIWNICDAVKVAKVKNMYYQARRRHDPRRQILNSRQRHTPKRTGLLTGQSFLFSPNTLGLLG